MSPLRRGVAVALATLLSLAAFLSGSEALSPPGARAEVTIGVDRGTVEMSVAPGQTVQDTIRVENPGDEPIQVMLYTANAEYSEDGEVQFERSSGDPAQYLQSPASWIRLRVPDETKIYANTPYIELQPGGSFPVEFQVDVPAEAPPGDQNAFIFFHMFELGDAGPQTGSAVSGRIGTRLHMRVVGDVVDDLSIGEFFARTLVVGKQLPYTIRIANDGNIDKFYSVRLELTDGGDEPVLTSQVVSRTVTYAQASNEFAGVVDVAEAGIGRYELVSLVDYEEEIGGGGTTQPSRLEERVAVWVIPLWLAIGSVVLVGLLLMWFSYRSTKRRAKRRRARRARGSGRRRGERAGPQAEGMERDRHRSEEPSPQNVSERERDEDRAIDRGSREGGDIWVPDSLFGSDTEDHPRRATDHEGAVGDGDADR
jgi:hypothetical protein